MSQEIISSGSGFSGNMLSLSQYATAHGISTRTVKRWLADEQLPGAEKDAFTGEWQIPAHATRQLRPRSDEQPATPREPGSAVATHLFGGRGEIQPMPQLQQLEPSLRDDLDDESAFLTIDEASRYLGIPQAQILRNADRFGLERVGTNGSYRLPQRVVREIAGY